MRHFKFPKWTKRIFPEAIWDFYFKDGNAIYITFDDGPNSLTTPWILDLLKEYQVKATFFCLGENVKNNPSLYQEILNQGHQIGNHSMHHPKGWMNENNAYLQDVLEAEKHIDSKLFRPPYGKIKPKQFKVLKEKGFEIVFWSLLTYDFDETLKSSERLKVIRRNVKPGSIIVFHDSEKAIAQLKNELPILLKEWVKSGYKFGTIETN